MHKIRLLTLSILIGILSGCSTASVEFTEVESKLTTKLTDVILAKPRLISGIMNFKSDRERFDNNTFVGLITMNKEGMIRAIGVAGLPEVRARKIEFSTEDMFASDSLNWLEGSLKNALEKANISYSLSDQNIPIKFEKKINRTVSPDESQDNINLPRYHYIATESISEKLIQSINKPAGGKYLLIPVVVYYYAHTPGWFNGQEWGCQGGIRIGVNLIFYDMASGKKVDELMIERKKIFKIGRVLNYTTYMGELDELKAEIEKQWINIFLP